MSRSSDEYLRGVPTKPYDLVSEGVIALGIVAALVIVLAIIFKSPDAPTITGLKDTTISIKDTVLFSVSTHDTNGILQKYYCSCPS